jgi:hypothetical protein
VLFLRSNYLLLNVNDVINSICLIPTERTLTTEYKTGDWVGPRAGAEAVVKRKTPVENRTAVIQLAA